METIPSADESKVTRQSSIWQFEGTLAVRKGDEWVPIAFDALDGFDCNAPVTHKAILTVQPHIGYTFPVKECRYLSQTVVLSDQVGKELKALPGWFGVGFYESYYDRVIAVNADNGALGTVNDTTLRVGLDYVLAKETLPAVA